MKTEYFVIRQKSDNSIILSIDEHLNIFTVIFKSQSSAQTYLDTEIHRIVNSNDEDSIDNYFIDTIYIEESTKKVKVYIVWSLIASKILKEQGLEALEKAYNDAVEELESELDSQKKSDAYLKCEKLKFDTEDFDSPKEAQAYIKGLSDGNRDFDEPTAVIIL